MDELLGIGADLVDEQEVFSSSDSTAFYAPPSSLTFGQPGPLLERVHVPLHRSGGRPLPVVLITIHDGHRVPTCAEAFARELDPAALERSFVRERDWGADAVAFQLASLLGLPSYHRITTARIFLDCGRPRGISYPDQRGLDTKAVPHRIAGIETPDELRRDLLAERCAFGDAFGQLLERTLESSGRRVLDSGALFLAVHTYDRFGARLVDPHGERPSERAPISLVYRPRLDEKPPAPLLDETLRDTTDPGLVQKLDNSFRASSIHAVHNDPYALPMGGLEIPALNWMFERAQREDPDLDPCHPRRRPSALVIEYRKDLLVDGFHTREGWFHPTGSWRRRAIREVARTTALPILAHFREIDPERYTYSRSALT